jgi:hypothetical protein
MINEGDGTQIKPIPRYFKKLWEKENWEEYFNTIWNDEEDHKLRIEMLKEKTTMTFIEYLKQKTEEHKKKISKLTRDTSESDIEP